MRTFIRSTTMFTSARALDRSLIAEEKRTHFDELTNSISGSKLILNDERSEHPPKRLRRGVYNYRLELKVGARLETAKDAPNINILSLRVLN